MFRSIKVDEQAHKKYTKAYNKQAEASTMLAEKKQEADDSFMKLANRKKAILSGSMDKFIELYSKIIKIDFQEGEGIRELNANTNVLANLDAVKQMTSISHLPMSDTEYATTFLVEGAKGCIFGAGVVGVTSALAGTAVTTSFGAATGITVAAALGGASVTAAISTAAILGPVGLAAAAVVGVSYGVSGAALKQSENNLARARTQDKLAQVQHDQAETICVAMDGMIDRSEKLAAILAKLNVLFMKSIKQSERVIEANGYNRQQYSREDRDVLKVCINLADAVKKIIDTPLIDQEGRVTKASLEAIDKGNECLQKLRDFS